MKRLVLFSLTPASVLAQQITEQKSVISSTSLLNMFGSLLVVLALVVLLAWLYKKMAQRLPGSGQIKVVTSLALGPRERILVIEIQGKQRVIGVTAQQVNFLFELEQPLSAEPSVADWRQHWQKALQGQKDRN